MHSFSTKSIAGLVIFVVGLLCFLFPTMGALDIEAMLGVIILLAGIFHLVGSLEDRDAIDFTWCILRSIAFLAFGVFLVADPYGGVQILSFIMFLFFLVQGILTIAGSFSQKSTTAKWYWTFFSGGVSLIVAAMLFFGFPFGDQWTIGMLSGVALIAYGMSVLVVSGVVEDKN